MSIITFEKWLAKAKEMGATQIDTDSFENIIFLSGNPIDGMKEVAYIENISEDFVPSPK